MKLSRLRPPVVPRAIDLARRSIRQLRILSRMGPVHYAGYRREVRRTARAGGHTFANGVTTTLTAGHASVWQQVWGKPLVVAIVGGDAPGLHPWVERLSGVVNRLTVISPTSITDMAHRAPVHHGGEIPSEALLSADLPAIWEWMLRCRRRYDLILLDSANPLPAPEAIGRLQHAAHAYFHDDAVGFAVPAYTDGEITVSGWDWDASAREFVAQADTVRDYGQSTIPRYVLTAAPHGFYATSMAIDRVGVPESDEEKADLAARVRDVVKRGWLASLRTLCFSSVVMEVAAIPAMTVEPAQREWLSRRSVSRNGRTRIVFVLNATSVSGGIRIVFELANGLLDRGFDVEIFSVQGQPAWFDLRAPLRTYRSYEDLTLALRNVDAIKVATWWETADIVWLASTTRGIPAFLVQEFETWFYPDNPVAQAAVVASYRREFRVVTEASFQRAELAEIGVEAALVPNGYDASTFHVLPQVERDQDSVLALGRSFFQKNFAMTADAWRSLGEERPRLVLFGTEPHILEDERVEYHERPSDAEVNVLYNRATIFVQTSRHEGFCLPVLEAMAAGCPVITTDSHGNRDFCRDGENCIIVPQDDRPALAAAIRLLLDDPSRREALATAGLETAKRYTWGKVLDEVARHYNGIAASAADESS